MSKHGTGIEWTHFPDSPIYGEFTGETWNPIRARNKETGAEGHFCIKQSPACVQCYAERLNLQQHWLGTGVPYTRDGAEQVEFYLNKVEQPLRWQKPRSVFVCSMTDLFLPEYIEAGYTEQVVDVIEAAGEQHIFIILTKQAERMHEILSDRWRYTHEAPGNVIVSVSAEDQKRADERVPLLLDTPAAVRAVSYEPALGAVDFTPWLEPKFYTKPQYDPRMVVGRHNFSVLRIRPPIDWMLVGGESGYRRDTPGRPSHPDWFRQVRDDCAEVETAFFMKQWGDWRPGPSLEGVLITPEGEIETTNDLHSLSTPPGWTWMKYAGKQAAGHLLDGTEYFEFPTHKLYHYEYKTEW